MQKNVRARETTSPTEKELGAIITSLRVPNLNIVLKQFAIHRLAALAREDHDMVSDKIHVAKSTDSRLARNLWQMAMMLPEPATKKVDQEVAEEFTPTHLSGRALNSEFLQQGLQIGTPRLRPFTNELEIVKNLLEPTRFGRRHEDPRKVTEKLETGSTNEWTGTGIAYDQ